MIDEQALNPLIENLADSLIDKLLERLIERLGGPVVSRTKRSSPKASTTETVEDDSPRRRGKKKRRRQPTLREESVIDFLKKNGPTNIAGISKGIGYTPGSVSKKVADLSSSRHIKMVKEGTKVLYMIPDRGKKTTSKKVAKKVAKKKANSKKVAKKASKEATTTTES